MKISIVTPSLNQANFIEDAILSVKNQGYPDFEHIVVDGGSTDGTTKILKKYPHLKWISEKDGGQSNAINKGFRMATGEVIAWLNSDDCYEKNIFGAIAEYFEKNAGCFFLYGDITYVDENGKILDRISGDQMTYANIVKNPDLVRQPSCFWRKEVLQTIGFINENLHLVLDYDYFLRIGKRHSFCYLNRNVSYFRSYDGNKTSRLKRKQVHELRMVMGNVDHRGWLRFYRFIFERHVWSVKSWLRNRVLLKLLLVNHHKKLKR